MQAKATPEESNAKHEYKQRNTRAGEELEKKLLAKANYMHMCVE